MNLRYTQNQHYVPELYMEGFNWMIVGDNVGLRFNADSGYTYLYLTLCVIFSARSNDWLVNL